MANLTVLVLSICFICFIREAATYSLFSGVPVVNAKTGENIEDLSRKLDALNGNTLLILGTYAADFNAIEYGQRLRYYLPKLKAKGVENFLVVLNASPQAAQSLASLLDLQDEIELYSDSKGQAGRAFGVSRGFQPEDLTNPYLKLLAMLFGLGAYATLPAVIGGYIGNPWSSQPWIADAMAQGQKSGRWPDTALEIAKGANGEEVINNKFDDLPYVGGWGRRPLELATLRLQNMIGISLKNWDVLKPTEEELQRGLLTQLGGCVLLDEKKKPRFEWKDAGICHVANFEDILRQLDLVPLSSSK